MKSQSSKSQEQPIYEKMKKALHEKVVNSISRGESHKKEIHSSFEDLHKAFDSVQVGILGKNVSQGTHERSYTHKKQKAVFASSGLTEDGLTQGDDAKKPEKKSEIAVSNLKTIWNDTVQTLIQYIVPIKQYIRDEVIILTKTTINVGVQKSKGCFESLNKFLEIKVHDYFDSNASKGDSFLSNAWNSVKSSVAKPLVELLMKCAKETENKITSYLVEFANDTEKNSEDLSNQKKLLENLTKQEYSNLKELFSECGNYISASIVEKLGHLTDFNHDSGSTNFESNTIGNDSQCGCAIF